MEGCTRQWAGLSLVLNVTLGIFLANATLDGHSDVVQENTKVFERFATQDLEILRLESRISKLSDRVEEIVGGRERTYKYIRQLQGMVNGLEGNHCPPGNIPCWPGSYQCVAAVNLCDGIKDCRNGADEDDYTCDVPVLPGSLWIGTIDEDDCSQNDFSTSASLFIASVELRPVWFPTLPKITVLWIGHTDTDVEQEEYAVSASGYYDYANREMRIISELHPHTGMDRLIFACKFEALRTGICKAVSYHEANFRVCSRGTYTMHQQFWD